MILSNVLYCATVRATTTGYQKHHFPLAVSKVAPCSPFASAISFSRFPLKSCNSLWIKALVNTLLSLYSFSITIIPFSTTSKMSFSVVPFPLSCLLSSNRRRATFSIINTIAAKTTRLFIILVTIVNTKLAQRFCNVACSARFHFVKYTKFMTNVQPWPTRRYC